MFKPALHQAAHLVFLFIKFHIISRYEPPRGTWFRTLNIIIKVSWEGEKRRRRKKPHLPAGFEPMVSRLGGERFNHCATTNEEWTIFYAKMGPRAWVTILSILFHQWNLIRSVLTFSNIGGCAFGSRKMNQFVSRNLCQLCPNGIKLLQWTELLKTYPGSGLAIKSYYLIYAMLEFELSDALETVTWHETVHNNPQIPR